MSFFTESRHNECSSGETAEGLVLTTSTIPNAFTCFNLAELFASNNTDIGFQNATIKVTDPTGDSTNGVHWLLQNHYDFESDGNYSSVWFQQFNMTAGQAGEEATWVLHLYAFDDCEQLGSGYEQEPEDFPWFETSCQTEKGGQCQTVPNSIRSFGINSAAKYNDGHRQCEEWAFLGDAAGLMPRWSTLSALAVGLVAVLGLM